MQPTLTQYIEIRKNRSGEDRAYLADSRVRVQDIVSDHERHGLSPDEIVRQHPHLSLAQIHSALAYYFDHKEEVWACIRCDEQFAESLRGQLKAPVPTLSNLADDASSVSS